MGIRYDDFSDTAEEVPEAQQAARALPIKNRATACEFEWWHHPAGWSHVDSLGWVPQPLDLMYKPGANGVGGQAAPNGGAAYVALGPARTGMAAKGCIQLDRRKVPGGDYVRRHRTTAGRWHYTDRWTSYSVLGNRLITKCDVKARSEWLLSLATAGVIDAMPREVLDQQIATLDHRIDRLANDPRVGNLAVADKMTKAKAKRDAMVADFERQFGAKTEAA